MLKPPCKSKDTVCANCCREVICVVEVEETKILKIFTVTQKFDVIFCMNCKWEVKVKHGNLDYIKLEQKLIKENYLIAIADFL